MIDAFLSAIERRRSTGERVTPDTLARATCDAFERWGARRALVPDDAILHDAGVLDALRDTGIEVIVWPSDLGWRPLLGLDDAPATCAITVPAVAVAQRGTVVLAADSEHGRSLDAVGWWHLSIVPADRIVWSLGEAFARVFRDGAPSAVSLVSGPSRTSDIEKITTYGAHGALAEHVLVADGLGGRSGG